MLLEIRESRMEPDITVIQLSGRLELGSECQRIESLAAGLLADGVLCVMLDLTRVEYIDSAGIGVLVMAAGQLKRAGGGMVLVLGEGKMKAMLHVTGLDDDQCRWPIRPNMPPISCGRGRQNLPLGLPRRLNPVA